MTRLSIATSKQSYLKGEIFNQFIAQLGRYQVNNNVVVFSAEAANVRVVVSCHPEAPNYLFCAKTAKTVPVLLYCKRRIFHSNDIYTLNVNGDKHANITGEG